uniref:Polyhomeotic-like protein 2 n=1 Tax=Sphaeramia orbicularis TaxID=375764 RepID=A0A672ZKB4_9TELE
MPWSRSRTGTCCGPGLVPVHAVVQVLYRYMLWSTGTCCGPGLVPVHAVVPVSYRYMLWSGSCTGTCCGPGLVPVHAVVQVWYWWTVCTDRLLMVSFGPSEVKPQQEPMLTCELCGRVDFAYIFKRSKRFCSTFCAKRYNVGCTKRMGLFPNRKTTLENLKKQRALNGNHKNSTLEVKKKTPPSVQKPPVPVLSGPPSIHPAQAQSSQCSELSGYDLAPSPLLTPQRLPVVRGSDVALLTHSCLPSDPGKWNVDDVYEFICSLPGCLEIAEEFRCQEIDGQALLLLKEDHLMGTMNIKLGPALKIFAQISLLKDS